MKLSVEVPKGACACVTCNKSADIIILKDRGLNYKELVPLCSECGWKFNDALSKALIEASAPRWQA